MNKKIAALVCSGLLLCACADNKVINGREYETYGLINQEDKKDPSVKYSVSWGNVFWGCALAETIIAPVYFFGFSLWEPEHYKHGGTK
jgi:hypothetical protein